MEAKVEAAKRESAAEAKVEKAKQELKVAKQELKDAKQELKDAEAKCDAAEAKYIDCGDEKLKNIYEKQMHRAQAAADGALAAVKDAQGTLKQANDLVLRLLNQQGSCCALIVPKSRQ